DHFGVGFATVYDRRSGYMFYANPIGGSADYSVVDEGGPHTDWKPACSVKTLRYTSGDDQVWGIQFRRSVRRKNEWTYWTPVPRQMAGPQALNRVSAF